MPLAPESRANANILTTHDRERLIQGLPPQQYDAFILFADEDAHFATEIIDKMEEYGLKVIESIRDE